MALHVVSGLSEMSDIRFAVERTLPCQSPCNVEGAACTDRFENTRTGSGCARMDVIEGERHQGPCELQSPTRLRRHRAQNSEFRCRQKFTHSVFEPLPSTASPATRRMLRHGCERICRQAS